MSEAGTAITVVISDDDADVRSSLAWQLASKIGIAVVGMASDADSAIRLAQETTPTVALVDFDMPGGGERAVKGILAVSPGTHVVALSGRSDAETTRAMLGAGAGSYLVKGASPDDLVTAVVRAAKGETILAAEVARDLMGDFTARLERDRATSAETQRLTDSIRRTIDEELLFASFQPIVDLESERVVAFEALCRFPQTPVRAPDRWFADAEAVGLRPELELAAAAAAFESFSAYPGDEALAVNASPDVLGRVAELGSRLGAQLIVEVTENAAIKDYEAVAEALSRHRASGVHLAVDDAGAGFASFRHVVELRPDFIKLDQSLVRNVDRDLARRALARGLIGFGKELGIAVVAEGVESPAELRALRELGVDRAQGFLLGRPGPLPALETAGT